MDSLFVWFIYLFIYLQVMLNSEGLEILPSLVELS